MTKIKLYNLILLFCLLGITACKDKYDDPHFKNETGTPTSTLLDQIKSRSELSQFAGYLSKTGYDTLLASSKLFTVWAPNNDAIAGVNPTILNDPTQLKSWVANQIAYGAYYTQTPDSALTIYLINNKALQITKNSLTVNGATIVTPNLACTNGVLQVINKAFPLLQNIWGYFQANSNLAPKQSAYLLNQNYVVIDYVHSPILRVNSIGQNVYDTLRLTKNYFLTGVKDLSDETQQYTFFMLTDNAFNNLSAQYRPYFMYSRSGQTDTAVMANICQDMVFKGNLTTLPDTLVSFYNVKIPVDKSSIKGSYQASNGMVYIIDNCPVRMKDKIQPVIIQGESYPLRTTAFNYILNQSASGGSFLQVIALNNPNYGLGYPVNIATSVKYNISWAAPSMAYNVNTVVAVTVPLVLSIQGLSVRSGITNLKITTTVPTPCPISPNTPVTPTPAGIKDTVWVYQTNAIQNVSIGSCIFTTAGIDTLKVISGVTPTGTPLTITSALARTAPILLDYIKLVPVLP